MKPTARRRPVRRERLALFATLVVVAASLLAYDQAKGAPGVIPSSPQWELLAQRDGATLRRTALPDGTAAFLMTIDVRRIRISQVLGPHDSAAAEAAVYYPGADSPRFRRITMSRMQQSCQSSYGTATFSAVNFSFFEKYEPSTQLSFPVKADGVIVTGGSSLYGPVPAPANGYYRGATLKALSWNDQRVRIDDYDPRTGAPLNQASVRDAVVTYKYTDHPSYALSGDPANRYQLFGVRDADGVDGAEQLLFATVVDAPLETAAQLLRQQGVKGDILTVDGGPSVVVWSATTGALQSATNREKALPHYLCFHATSPVG